MADTERRSALYALDPLIKRWPTVLKPEGHVSFKTKLLWTTVCLIFYFILSNIPLWGVSAQQLDLFENFRAILAGSSGSLMHLGIGPIVTGSIVMQLFTGAKIIKLDLTKEEDKRIYQGAQKIMVLLFIFIESIPQVYGFLNPDQALVDKWTPALGEWAMFATRSTIVGQLAAGAIIVFLMDELISKWGIGSGISLFIAAGVSQALFQGTLSMQAANTQAPLNPVDNPFVGTIPMVIYVFWQRGLPDLVHSGGFEDVFIGNPNTFPNPVIAFLGTIMIFIFVVYAESTRIELPLAHGKVRGARGRYPLRLIYASNIPVILMAALLANINIFSLLLWQHPTFSKIPVIGHAWWIGSFQTGSGSTSPTAGGAWYLTNFRGLNDWFLPLIDDRYSGYVYGHEWWQIVIKIVIFLTLFIGGSIMFAKFWVETTNMGPASVAKQIEKSGMQIPGFRRDPRVLEKVLERYIPTLTIIGGATVGLLAAVADMIGTVGQASGTGLLLCVGIFMRMYEQIAKEQVMEMHPVLRGFFGAE